MNRTLRYFLGGIFVLVLTIVALSRILPFQDPLKAAGLSSEGIDEFTVIEERVTELSGFRVTTILAQKDSVHLRLALIKDMDSSLASIYEEEKRIGIESLFLTQPAHYPGIITKEVECSDEFLPETGTVGSMKYYIMYANDRFSYGVCSPDLIAYRSVFAFGYCNDQSAFIEARIFYPPEEFLKDEALEILGSFQCR